MWVSYIKLSDNYKKEIIKEFKFISEKIKDTGDLGQVIFYLSAAHGIINRILNFEFDPHLLFIHFVLNQSFQSIKSRVDQTLSRRTTIPIAPEFFFKFSQLLDELTQVIEKDEEAFRILEKITTLVYTITGNGYYLQQKGIIKLNF